MKTLALKLRDAKLWAGENQLLAALSVLLWALALLSVAQGFRNAVEVSTDFQWSPVFLLSERVNPYEVALAGNPGGKIFLSQYPPYLQLLYLVMLPLAYLPYTLAKFIWAVINFGFACLSLVLLNRLFRLTAFQGSLLAALFFLSTPYRNAVGNGQTSFLCLLTFLIAWLYQNRNVPVAGASLSLLLTKYSFAPPIGLWFLLKGRLTMLIVSFLLLTAGWLAFSWICNENPLLNLSQPVKVAAMYSESEGGGDIMTLIQSFGLDSPVVGSLRLSALAGLLTSTLWVVVLRSQAARMGELACLAGLCLVSLLAIRHLAYDFVFLAPVAALTFTLPRLPKAVFIVTLTYLGLGLKVLTSFNITGAWVELASFLALNLMFFILLFSAKAPVSAAREA